MITFKDYLESSTVHGLVYISATRRFVRFFWVLVVVAGFTGAGYLIYQSFQDWSDNPIKTTIETFPIEKAQYPKITVCPPKDTYTDLNYDLMTLGNKTIHYDAEDSNSVGVQLMDSFVRYFQNKDFEKFKTRISSLYEKDKYRNWYLGISKVPVEVLAMTKVSFDDNVFPLWFLD